MTAVIGEGTMINIGDIFSEGVGTAAGWLVSALVATGFAAQKLMKNWNETSAGNMLIVNLREEVDRLATQNKQIATLLQSHQAEIFELQRQVNAREVRIESLEREVTHLRLMIPVEPPNVP
jgi:peptidoglycan hydrolase CwlO-like protein